MTDAPLVLSIGHSNHPWPAFLDLLQRNEVGAIVDVRSMPASRRYPQFNRDAFERALGEAGVGYRFLGDRLGGTYYRRAFVPSPMTTRGIASADSTRQRII